MASYERTDMKTPKGGDYSEIYYLNGKHDVVDSSEATQFMLRECKADGTLICTTYGFIDHK